MRKEFFYVERTQTWFNLRSVIMVFRNGQNWRVILQGDMAVELTEAEYFEFKRRLEESRMERGEHDGPKDEHHKKEGDDK